MGKYRWVYFDKSCFGRHVMTEVIDVVLCSSCPSECGRSNGLGFVSRLRFVIAELRRYYGMGYFATSDATRSRMERLGVKPERSLGALPSRFLPWVATALCPPTMNIGRHQQV